MAKKSHAQSFSVDYCPSLAILDVYMKSCIFKLMTCKQLSLQVVSEYDDVTGKMTFDLSGIKCHQLHHFILLDLCVKIVRIFT